MKYRKNSVVLISSLSVALIAMMASVLLTSCGTKKQHNSSSSSALSSSSVSCLALAPSSSSSSSSSSVQSNYSSLSPADKKQIIDSVSDALKGRYPDMNVTNQWLGDKEENRYTVLFGSLKSDPQQGVAQMILESADGKNILQEERILDTMKTGALKVVSLESARDNGMVVEDSAGNKLALDCYMGLYFNGQQVGSSTKM